MKANAAKAHEDLGKFVQQAIDKGAHSAEAIEADRLRLVNEVRAPLVFKLNTLPHPCCFACSDQRCRGPEGDEP